MINKEYQKLIDKLVKAKETKNTSYIDEVIYSLNHLGEEPEISINTKEFMAITHDMAKTYAAKNHDYGNSFEQSLDKFGIIASVVRLGDKMNRIESLTKKDAKVKDESIKDTLLDLANYCIMTVMWVDKQKNN